ncbi:MAG: hypothetical protein OEY59_02880 [Deltaproteobacteria bacterium]|nr:hypothetical protein [Deltaproteobacteria bacterium]
MKRLISKGYQGGYILIMMILSLTLVGCKTDNAVTTAANTGETTYLYGKIVDAETSEGIASARVSVKVDGTWHSVYTKTGNNDEVLNNKGDFVFTNLSVPGTGEMTIVVDQGRSKTQYIPYYGTLGYDLPTTLPTDSTYINDGNIGDIPLNRGTTATVYVVDSQSGDFITRPGDEPIAIYDADARDGVRGSAAVPIIKAKQDTTDLNKYSIDVPVLNLTTLYVPSFYGTVVYDATGDITSDSTRFSTNMATTITEFEKNAGSVTKYISMTRLANGTGLSTVADNLFAVGTGVGTAQTVIKKNQVIKLFFNMPVQFDTTNHTFLLYTTDNLRALTATEYVLNTTVAVTPALSMDNTMLSLTPNTALTENATYSVSGMLKSLSNTDITSMEEVYQISGFIPNMYVDNSSATSIGGATPKITLDNFNFCTGGSRVQTPTTPLTTDTPPAWGTAIGDCTVGGDPNSLYLVFPEHVWGAFTVNSFTHAGTTYPSPLVTTAIAGQSQLTGASAYAADGLGYFDNTIGYEGTATPAIYTANEANPVTRMGSNYGAVGFRTSVPWASLSNGSVPINGGPTTIDVSDDTATAANTVNISLDVYDGMGNQLQTTTEYTIE